MQKVTLSVDQRTQTGKGPARRLRMEGKAPAVLYGKKNEPIKLVLNIRDFGKIIETAGANALFDLQIQGLEGKTFNRTALLKERQVKPVDGALVHVDFLEVLMTESIHVTVPLHFEGKPAGVDKGGTFQSVSKELKISCLPDAIPGFVMVDITGLDLGHSIHAGEIALPEGVALAQDPAVALATLLAPKKMEVEEAAEGAEAPAAAPAAKK